MIQRLLAAAAGAVLLLTASAASAFAHDALVSSNPAANAQVDVAPEQVQLVFTEPPLGVGTRVEVTSPDGAIVSVGTPSTVDATVTQPLPPDLPAGSYRVRWRVTSSDGHPISGAYTFTTTTRPTANPRPPNVEPVPVQASSPSPTTVAAPKEAPASTPSGSWSLAIVTAAVTLFAAAVTALLLQRRRSN